jgi:hypothetical protein
MAIVEGVIVDGEAYVAILAHMRLRVPMRDTLSEALPLKAVSAFVLESGSLF